MGLRESLFAMEIGAYLRPLGYIQQEIQPPEIESRTSRASTVVGLSRWVACDDTPPGHSKPPGTAKEHVNRSQRGRRHPEDLFM
jgi:hypothetical protein